jgi:hypothetical protein
MFSHSHLLKELQQFIVENDASAVAGVPATVGCFCPWFPFEFAAAVYSAVFYVKQSLESLLWLIPEFFSIHSVLLAFMLFLCLAVVDIPSVTVLEF